MNDLFKLIILIAIIIVVFPNIILIFIGFIAIYFGIIQTIFDTSQTGAYIIGSLIAFLLLFSTFFKKK